MYIDTTPGHDAMAIKALLWNGLRKLAVHPGLTQTLEARIRDIIQFLGFEEISIVTRSFDKVLTVDPRLKLTQKDHMPDRVDRKAFQLLHCGPYFDRNLDSVRIPPSRVATMLEIHWQCLNHNPLLIV